uniref:Peptidase M12B domain-containing protein n=1 Tax=Callorhinchus milii TaxID=7868 RepID=A0A4W3GWL2_CALMI
MPCNVVSQFLKHNEDLKKTQQYLISLAYHLHQIYYSQLNIKIFLVGIEIWNKENKVPISYNSSIALRDFMRWSSTELLPRKHYDYAQLISGVSFSEYSLGETYLAKMCTGDMSGGVVKDTKLGSRKVANYVTHEIGHNLGMPHDDKHSHCPAGQGTCLMSRYSRLWEIPMFSDSSKNHLNRFLTDKNKDISCLLDQPDNWIVSPKSSY